MIMESSTIFSTIEKREFLHSLLNICRHIHSDVDRAKIRALWNYADLSIKQNPSLLRDAFGLNQVVVATKTICDAIESVGISGDTLVAYFLKCMQTISADAKSIEEYFGNRVVASFQTYQRIAILLQVKEETLKTDAFRNLLVSQCHDIRILLLLILECRNKMSKIRDTTAVDERNTLSTEAAHIYAPLAHKLGLYGVKSQLEDYSLKYLETEAYYHIKEKLSATKKSRDAYIEEFIAPLREKLTQAGLQVYIKGRTKSIHSIWQKMKKQKCPFEGVYDLFAIRVIIEAPLKKEKEFCWKVFSLITNQYESNLKRLRDWLTVPKSNGYESLHITVLGPKEKWVEVQIRTRRMDDIAEKGLAAHWRYKGVKTSDRGVEDWLAGIRVALEKGDEKSLTESLNPSDKETSIYVFTPKGDLYKLPKNATVLDFAYAIHSKVGDQCVGARIDGKNVPIRYELLSGQKIEVLTSNTQQPKSEWLQLVVSGKAKSKIRASINDRQRAQTLNIKEEVERKLKNRKLEWNDGVWNQLAKQCGYKEIHEFYRAISKDVINLNEVIEQYVSALDQLKTPLVKTPLHSADEYQFVHEYQENQHIAQDVLVIDENIKGIDFKMAKCCNPIYGDEVFGFVSVYGGIKIHRKNCPNAKDMRSNYPYRIVDAKWAGKGVGEYSITLKIVGKDDLGIVNNITNIIAREEHVYLRNINIESNDGLFSGILVVVVKDLSMLNSLRKKLSTIKGVKSCERI